MAESKYPRRDSGNFKVINRNHPMQRKGRGKFNKI